MKRALLSCACCLLLTSVAAAQAVAPEVAAPAVPAPAPQAAPSSEASPPAGASASPAELEAQAFPLQASSAEAPAEISAADLEALGISDVSSGVDKSLRFSGFSDFTVWVPIKPKGAGALALPRYPTMYVGNLNVYLTKNLSESFRVMGEVRFTYLPNGNLDVNSGAATPMYTSSLARDYADLRRFAPWGSIMIQRMYLEWGGLNGLLSVRAGQFLTPYGIWNIDHGSPTYIPTQRPYAIGNDWFPERQTGIEAFGRWDPAYHSTIGYHVTFSNGAGPISDYRDLDRNKAFGGRLYWDLRKLGLFHLGVSGYYGRYTASQPSFRVANDDIIVTNNLIVQYDALALAADLQFKYEGLHVQSEMVTQQRRYTQRGRTAQNLPLSPVGRAYPADSLNWAYYALVGYRFNWYALMPYAMFQLDDEIFEYGYRTRLVSGHGGLNFHPIDEVTIKAEYFISKSLAQGGFLSKHPISAVEFQAAYAF